MRAAAALADLLRESPEFRRFFRECCEAGALRLRSQARQFRDELKERGFGDLAPADVEDGLMLIARKVLPETPAAEWDTEWAAELCSDALARISERSAGISVAEMEAAEIPARGGSAERMNAAAQSNDPQAFRKALREWERAILEGLEALESARRGAA